MTRGPLLGHVYGREKIFSQIHTYADAYLLYLSYRYTKTSRLCDYVYAPEKPAVYGGNRLTCKHASTCSKPVKRREIPLAHKRFLDSLNLNLG